MSAFLLGAAAPSAAAAQQCPDGTPPPCGRPAASTREREFAVGMRDAMLPLQRAGDFRSARMLACRALTLYPQGVAGLRWPWDCTVLRFPTAVSGGPPDELGRARASAVALYEARVWVDSVLRVVRDSLGLRELDYETLDPEWGIAGPSRFFRGVAPQRYCAVNFDLPTPVPCDSACARLEVSVRLTPAELVVGISAITYDTRRILVELRRLVARGHMELSSPVGDAMQDVPFADELRDSLISAEWEDVPLAEVMRVFAIGPVRAVVVNAVARGVRVTGRFARVPYFRALWDVLAGYNLRATRLGPTMIRVVSGPPSPRRRVFAAPRTRH